jgi:ABC-type dipeptide/oligopeptide/nickel transport system permease subunit
MVTDYPLGVDLVGRDVLSRLLWAMRPTLLICSMVVLARVTVGTLLGVLTGWFGGTLARLINGVRNVCIAFPILAFAVAAVLWLGADGGLRSFVLALTLTGWCDTASFVESHTRTVRHAAYIESAQAVGLRPVAVLWRHVVPQLWPVLPILVAFEFTAVTLLIGELGYLGYFVGGGFVYADMDAGVYILTGDYPELGQMLANVFTQLQRTPWVPIFAGALVVLQLSAFALVGEGLRQYMDITRPRRARWWLG